MKRCFLLSVFLAFFVPALCYGDVPPYQIDSIDNVGAEWDVEPYRSFDPALDLSAYEDISLWVKSDPDGAYLKQIILYDNTNSRIGRYDVPAASTPGWRKVTALLTDFVWEGGSSTTIDQIGLWTSCSETSDPPNAHDIYLDDLRVKTPITQLDDLDTIDASGWTDDRNTGLMLQTPPGDANFYEGTGSMKIEYTSRQAGWIDDRETGYMIQETDVPYVVEGTGSMRVAFENYLEGNYDIEAYRNFDPALDFSGYENYSLTLWLWTDLVNDSALVQIIIKDDSSSYNGRYNVTKPTEAGWTRIVAPLKDFSWYDVDDNPVGPDVVNWSAITYIGLWASCFENPGNSIYMDDLWIVDYVPPPPASNARVINAARATITVDGNASDWGNVDSDVVDFNLAGLPIHTHGGNLHVKYRMAWDNDYLYILIEEQPGDGVIEEAIEIGEAEGYRSMNDQMGGDVYFDELALYFDFTNTISPAGSDTQIALWLFLGLASQGQTDLMMAWTNGGWGPHKPEAVANGQYAETGTGLGNRVVETKVKWSDLDNAINAWRLPEGGLAAAVKPGYIFGCDPRLNDLEYNWDETDEAGSAWLNGNLWDDAVDTPPSGRDEYSIDVKLACPSADLDGDCDVDFGDFAVFAEQWLKGK
jgi:hypothetical protein